MESHSGDSAEEIGAACELGADTIFSGADMHHRRSPYAGVESTSVSQTPCEAALANFRNSRCKTMCDFQIASQSKSLISLAWLIPLRQ
jgi:hypothetical protein